jgi:uncharacterized protein (TIGR02118 family)
MVKMFGAMNRLDHVTREAFIDYYVNEHVKVGGTMAGVLRYVSGAALQDANGGEPAFDAVSEHWWASTDSVRSAYTSDLWEQARRDHPSVVSGRPLTGGLFCHFTPCWRVKRYSAGPGCSHF